MYTVHCFTLLQTQGLLYKPKHYQLLNNTSLIFFIWIMKNSCPTLHESCSNFKTKNDLPHEWNKFTSLSNQKGFFHKTALETDKHATLTLHVQVCYWTNMKSVRLATSWLLRRSRNNKNEETKTNINKEWRGKIISERTFRKSRSLYNLGNMVKLKCACRNLDNLRLDAAVGSVIKLSLIQD